MSYAIIQLQGKQYRVSPGDTLVVDQLATEINKTLKVTDVLLVQDGKKISVGDPLVAGATVTFDVLEHAKGEKIRVATYKSKSRTRRVKGHRQRQTTLKVKSISA